MYLGSSWSEVMMTVHCATFSGCSDDISCLSAVKSHWLGCDSPVSDSFTPISSLTLAISATMS